MTMVDFSAQIPQSARDYFSQFPGGVVNATKLDGKYDITLNFSVAGMVIGGPMRGGDAGPVNGGAGQAPGQAVEPEWRARSACRMHVRNSWD